MSPTGLIRHIFVADLVLKDKIFVYDLSKKRIGWTDYDCKHDLLPCIHFARRTYKIISYSLIHIDSSGSNDVNVSITSSKDEFRNAGELSENSSSGTTTSVLMIAAVTIGSLLW